MPSPSAAAAGSPSGRRWLAIDLGTSAVKALLVDDHGAVRASGRADHPVSTPRPGWAETDPEDWWVAVGAAVRAAVAADTADAAVAGVGLSGQMHGVVLCDGAARPLRAALLWADQRAVAELAAYRALPTRALARLANPLSPGMAGPLLRWVATHEPEVLASSRWAVQPKDWLRLRLTGASASEPSDASATLLYDLVEDRWDDEVVATLGLPRNLLPPLRGSADVAGELAGDAAAHLGLPAGTPVVLGAADAAAAALGSGLTSNGPVQLTVGTGGQLVTVVDSPEPGVGTHLYRTATPHGWYAMAATLNAGLALGWVCDVLGVGWDELYAAAAAPPTPAAPLFLPFLAGERTPYLDPTLRAGWSGVGLDHGRVDLLRAALEGVACSLRVALDALPGAPDGPVLLAGGGSADPAWRQLLADVLDRPLLAVDAADASGRGAALLAAVGLGVVSWADLTGPLAPATRLVAEPRAATADLVAERLARHRAEVARRRTRGGAE